MISVEGLTKRYGSDVVVDDVSFTCAPGTITGFLGPNGAGKSTTLRMLCGLENADAGTATVAGTPFGELPNPPRTVGTLLDASALHPGRTGRAVLGTAARMAGVPLTRVEEVLDTVGLARGAAAKRVGRYSLGMRQRLGLAQALIGGPHVLVLDEPANGLDPEGIAWMRTLLKDFAERGGTVLLSSHLLAEVEATVDELVVIRRGAVVARGPVSELLAVGGTRVRAEDPVALRAVLDDAGLAYLAEPDGTVVLDVDTDITRVTGLAAERGVRLTDLTPGSKPGLEDLFFSVTSSTASPSSVADRTPEVSR